MNSLETRFAYETPSLFTFLGRHYIGIRNIIQLLRRSRSVCVLDAGSGPLEPFYFAELLRESNVHAVDLDPANVVLIEKIKREGILLRDLAEVSCNIDEGRKLRNEEFDELANQNIADYEAKGGRFVKKDRFSPKKESNKIVSSQGDIRSLDFGGYDLVYLGSVLQNVKKVVDIKDYIELLKRIRKQIDSSTVIAGATFYTEIYGPGKFIEELTEAGFDFPTIILEDVCTRVRRGKEVLVADYTWAIIPKGREYSLVAPEEIRKAVKFAPIQDFTRRLSLRPEILLYARSKGEIAHYSEIELLEDKKRRFFDVKVITK